MKTGVLNYLETSQCLLRGVLELFIKEGLITPTELALLNYRSNTQGKSTKTTTTTTKLINQSISYVHYFKLIKVHLFSISNHNFDS